MKKRLALSFVAAVLIMACAAHEKAGDQAAALGDWKGAYAQYSAALAKDPESPELQAKYQNARQQAIADAYRKAQACAAASDWSCAVGEADYALEVDSGNAEIAAFRANAARSLALARISQSHGEATQGRFRVAFDMIESAKALSNDASVAQEAERARAGLASMADAESDRLRQRKAYREAVEALSVAAAIDPSKKGKLDVAQREYDAWLTAEYERYAREGDQALARKDWVAAEAGYVSALKMRPGGRAEPLSRYAGGVAAAEAALARRDYASATQGYRQAVDSGQDTSGYATSQLQLVEVRPYTVKVRSVLARPMRPDGRPWAGRINPSLTRLMYLFTNEFLDPRGRDTSRKLMDAAMAVPPENRPNLSVRVSLPDGTVLTTPAQTGLYVAYESEFVVATNSFDERKLSLRVVHGDGNGWSEDVGVVEFPLGEIVRRRDAQLSDQSVHRLQLSIEPATPGKADGMFANMFPMSDGSNLAQDFSSPTPASAGFRLRSVWAVVPAQALMAEPDEGAGELVVEIVQRGRVVYRSPQLDNLYEAQWAANNVTLYVEQGEQLRVLVWDIDPNDRDLLVDATITAESLFQGSANVASSSGASARIQVEPRQSWAGGVVP
jgi:tetratricopeptide (TPR) repeat protein